MSFEEAFPSGDFGGAIVAIAIPAGVDRYVSRSRARSPAFASHRQ